MASIPFSRFKPISGKVRVKTRKHCIGYDLTRLTESPATEALARYARRRGWHLNRVFTESSEKQQTKFKKLLRTLRPEDTILVESLTRLPNGIKSLLQLLSLFERGKLSSIILVSDGIVFSRTNRACRRYIQMLRAQERAEKQIKVTRSRIALRLASMTAAQIAERKITPEIETDVLRLRYDEHLTIRAIARKFSTAPIRISRGSIQGILRRHSNNSE